jgi:hypothetical protein
MELLIYGTPHRVAHDLESLFYVLLFICTHLGGPRNTLGNPPLYGETDREHNSKIKTWLSSTNLVDLGMLKYSHMFAFFESTIVSHISPYFKPLQQHLYLLRKTIFPHWQHRSDGDVGLAMDLGKNSVCSVVTCSDVIEAFKTILLDESLISQAEKPPTTLGKRSLPGDYDTVKHGWDVIKPSRKVLATGPKFKQSNTVRRAKLLLKGK